MVLKVLAIGDLSNNIVMFKKFTKSDIHLINFPWDGPSKVIDIKDGVEFFKSVKVKDVLSSFHVKALDYHIKKLEKLILESFNNLHRKKNYVKSIKINTSSFELQLFEKKNIEIDTDKLSAGERQLLAVAILWGLAKASNSAAPTIIDTPLGRLDSEHRLNLVEQYLLLKFVWD